MAATIRKVDHVAIVVPSIAEAVSLFCDALGGEFLSGGDNDETGVRLVHLRLPGFKLELLQPCRPDSFLQRHLDERGPGFHHMTFFVDDLRRTVSELGSAGFGTSAASFSAAAWKEAFLSPRSAFGALLQFVETTRRWDEPEPGITLADVLDGRVVWQDFVPCLRPVQPMSDSIHMADKAPAAPALPIPEALLRSRRQFEILGVILSDPDAEFPLSALARHLGIPYSSVHREIERAEHFGIVTTRRFENLRLVRANPASPHYANIALLFQNTQLFGTTSHHGDDRE
jgi:methylmalonyl-CoA/ethylmalonyl-CoA epimerase